jgi:hypothetical protein
MMKKEYRETILKIIPNEKVLRNCVIKEISAVTVLLVESEIPIKLFIIIKGCL